MIENKKRYFMIVGVFCIISALIGGTLAWYTWQSENNTNVSFTVGGVDITFDAGADITSSKLRPVSTKEYGVENDYAIEKTITASSPVTAYLNLYLTLETLPNGLKEESFIWEIYKDNTLVSKGNFKDNNQGDKVTIASNQEITSTTYTYKLYIWIDGANYSNPETMQNQTFKFVLNADATDQVPIYATDFITNIFDEASKTTVNNNSIEYQYAPSIEMMEDIGGNIRYYGADPNNYISFNNESWRIIGVFKDIDDGTGEKETRIKLIRNESIGNYSWDSSDSSINNGLGINEWSQSDLMYLLNFGAYWNRTSGMCYVSGNNATVSCDFSAIGLTTNSKNLIGEAIWNLGGSSIYDNLYADEYYTFERQSDVMINPSDGITRNSVWKGKVGLMYPSDYMYAGDLSKCNEYGNKWNSDQSNCRDTSWLRDTTSVQWTMTQRSNSSSHAFHIYSSGYVYSTNAVRNSSACRPVIYLKTTVQVIAGDGTVENPYVLL